MADQIQDLSYSQLPEVRPSQFELSPRAQQRYSSGIPDIQLHNNFSRYYDDAVLQRLEEGVRLSDERKLARQAIQDRNSSPDRSLGDIMRDSPLGVMFGNPTVDKYGNYEVKPYNSATESIANAITKGLAFGFAPEATAEFYRNKAARDTAQANRDNAYAIMLDTGRPPEYLVSPDEAFSDFVDKADIQSQAKMNEAAYNQSLKGGARNKFQDAYLSAYGSATAKADHRLQYNDLHSKYNNLIMQFQNIAPKRTNEGYLDPDAVASASKIAGQLFELEDYLRTVGVFGDDYSIFFGKNALDVFPNYHPSHVAQGTEKFSSPDAYRAGQEEMRKFLSGYKPSGFGSVPSFNE